MGRVGITFKLVPEGPEEDIERIKQESRIILKKNSIVEPQIQEKPFFGLKILEATIIKDETEGGADPIKEELEKIKGLQSVSIENVTLV